MGTIRSSEGVTIFQQPGVGECRRVDSGDVSFEFGWSAAEFDGTPLFKGLPDSMCKCRHQGYVVRGQLTFKTKSGPIEVAAGEAYDVPPGHIPVYHPGCEWVQFSLTADQRKTDEAIQRNAAARAGAS
jgi:hypothetical protein